MKHVMEFEPINDNEAHLWFGDPESISDPCLLRHFRALLSKDEQEKIGRYRRATDRHTGLIARAAIRSLLSRYVSVDPSHWQFRSNRYGRLEIAEPSHARAFRFNIAHTAGMLTVLISKNRDVGVDVESLPYIGPYFDIAERFFAPAEVSTLRSLPESMQAERFIEYWILKESYTKARGFGLAMSLNEFYFIIDKKSGNEIEIHFSHCMQDSPSRWQFNLHAVGQKHIIATTIERLDCDRIKVARRNYIPRIGFV